MYKLWITQKNLWITCKVEQKGVNIPTTVVKRAGGRPRGSKNKRKALSRKNVIEICEYAEFNPALFLAEVANGTEDSEKWTKEDRLRAAGKLFDSVHGKAPLMQVDNHGEGPLQIAFFESPEDFQLPGDAGRNTSDCVAIQGAASTEGAEI